MRWFIWNIKSKPLVGPMIKFGNANQVHTFKQACVAVYPSTVQHEIIWFWPNSDPKYKNIIETNKPPYIPELEDPSFTKLMGNRDIPYGYLLHFPAAIGFYIISTMCVNSPFMFLCKSEIFQV